MSDATPNFAPTRWTLVLKAGSDSSEGRTALSELCEIYYAPVVMFICRRQGIDKEAARDQAHGFFESILKRQSLGAPNPERGRFRNYILGAVKHFLSEQLRAAHVEKRGGYAIHEPLDDTNPAPVVSDSHFDSAWAHALIKRAYTELETEMIAAKKAFLFETLAPWLDGNASVPQIEAANALSISEAAVKVAIHRLRNRFRAKVRAEVAATIDDPSELDAELRHLASALMARQDPLLANSEA